MNGIQMYSEVDIQTLFDRRHPKFGTPTKMASTSNSTSDQIPAIQEKATMLLKRITNEISIQNNLSITIIIVATVAFTMMLCAAYTIGRLQGHRTLLRRFQGMDEEEILNEVRLLCWQSTTASAPLPSISRRSAYTFVAYEGGSDTESEDQEYEYEPEYASTRSESIQEEYVFEGEAVAVDYLNTPD